MDIDDTEPMESMDTSHMQPASSGLQAPLIVTPIDSTSPPQPTMQTSLVVNDEGAPVLLSYTPLHSPYCHQVSMEEYREQATTYTQQAVKDLQASPEYRKYTERCHSCGLSWYDGQWTQGCRECGECAMHKPCPVCHGVCGSVWKRNIDMSHSLHEAHWDGCCAHKDAAAKIKQLLYMHSITDAMEDLQT